MKIFLVLEFFFISFVLVLINSHAYAEDSEFMSAKVKRFNPITSPRTRVYLSPYRKTNIKISGKIMKATYEPGHQEPTLEEIPNVIPLLEQAVKNDFEKDLFMKIEFTRPYNSYLDSGFNLNFHKKLSWFDLNYIVQAQYPQQIGTVYVAPFIKGDLGTTLGFSVGGPGGRLGTNLEGTLGVEMYFGEWLGVIAGFSRAHQIFKSGIFEKKASQLKITNSYQSIWVGISTTYL